jgi:cytochrome P450
MPIVVICRDLLTSSSAGHETTAHTLAFAIALLALYPDVQEKLHQHVKENVADPSGTPVRTPITRFIDRLI